jgi:hypothetical protein
MQDGGLVKVFDLSVSDSGALPAIAFISGSAVYLYKLSHKGFLGGYGLSRAAPGQSLNVAPPSRRLSWGRPAPTLRGQDALATAGKMPALPGCQQSQYRCRE